MKLKLSQLSHNVVILIENYDQYTRVYYSDGHNEIVNEQVKNLIPKRKDRKGYKNPILFEDVYLHPTHNQKEKDCKWINLAYLEEKDPLFIHLLEEMNLYDKAVKMYLREKEKILKDGIV